MITRQLGPRSPRKQLKKGHVQARLKFVNEHLNYSEENFGESVVVR